MSTVDNSTEQLIDYYLQAGTEAKDICALANAVASAANLQHYMDQHRWNTWHALCEKFSDWKRNLQTGK